MNYNIYRISRDKWNKIVNNHSRQHHNPPSGNQIYMWGWGARRRKKRQRRRDFLVSKLWRQQSEKEKLNIYTSIQCVVSEEGGGASLWVKLGVSSQPRDCTQWGISFQKYIFLFQNWSQNNTNFWVDSFITQIVPIFFKTGWRAAFRKLISTTTNSFF